MCNITEWWEWSIVLVVVWICFVNLMNGEYAAGYAAAQEEDNV